MVALISPVTLVGFEAPAAWRSRRLLFAAGANVTLTPTQTGNAITLTIAAEASGGSGLTQPQVLARLSMGI